MSGASGSGAAVEGGPGVGAPRSPSRRQLFGVAAGGAVVGAASRVLADRALRDDAEPGGGNSGNGGGDAVAYFGRNQAGILTPAQDRLFFAAFDVTTTDRRELLDLLRRWTSAAVRMTAGDTVGRDGAVEGPPQAPPEDTGEALGLSAARLTITFGFGRSLFVDDAGADRFGLRSHRPERLIDLPHFAGDKLDPARSNGDICVQACADDPQVAVHAVRNLARLGFGTVAVRWSQLGFGRTSSTSHAQATPRNLFGFKDGTANITVEEPADVKRWVWIDASDPSGDRFAGGSYLVARRINMHIETWDRSSLREQEALIGRDKGAGAPLSGGTEFSPINLRRVGDDDQPLVPVTSHVAVAHPDNNKGVRLLRRGYNFTDGTDGLGRLNAGLFFLAYVRDPGTQYVPMQTRMAANDALSEYLQHTGSGIYLVPPGVRGPGESIGDSLFV